MPFVVNLFILVASFVSVFANEANDAKHTVMIFGDSLSAAYRMSEEEGWVHLLNQRLASKVPNWRATNRSISGETTSGGLIRIEGALREDKPRLVVLELGGNDGLRGYPLHNIEANVRELVSCIQRYGATVVIAGMQLPPNYGPQYTATFRDLYANVAEDTASALIPFLLEGVATVDALMFDDGIHPNVAGQPIVLDNVWDVLGPVIADLDAESDQSVTQGGPI